MSQSIMIIDSEPRWLEFCRSTLESNGYQVFVTSTGEKAQKALDAKQQDWGLILVDIKSLEEDEVVTKILNQSRDDPDRSIIIVFPTNLTPTRVRKAFKSGATDCVDKPYDEAALLALIEQMLADHRINITKDESVCKESSNVLIVDDDNGWINSLERYLPQVDQVVKASDYQEAVDKVLLQSYDLAVIDLRLVDSDDGNFQGMDLISLIRRKDEERRSFTQIIVVSAHGTPEHIRDSYRIHDIHYYFDKRYFSPSKYKNMISGLMNRKSV